MSPGNESASSLDPHASRSDEISQVVIRERINLGKMIHLSAALQPNRMLDPGAPVLKNLPLDTCILELSDGFYASQAVAVFLKSNDVITGMSSSETIPKQFDLMVRKVFVAA